jgi:hypothetical protein
VKLCALLLNVAATFRAELTTRLQVAAVPLHPAPAQPANKLPVAGVAVSVTFVPNANALLHVVPQLTPAGVDVTVPVPVPLRDTVTCGRPMLIEIGSRASRLSVPNARIWMIPGPSDELAAAEMVRTLESVPPLSTGGLNVTAMPSGWISVALSVSGRS